MRRTSNAVQRRIDVVTAGARQPRHGARAAFTRHGAHAFEAPARGDGEAGLNDVHAKRFELPGHADFFRHGHGESRGLFPVSQRGIEDAYDVHRSAHSPALSISSQMVNPVKFIILVSAIKPYYRGEDDFSSTDFSLCALLL